MSLLMDALRRAETAKQESARNAQDALLPTAADMLSLEPIPPEPGKGPSNPLPDLAAHIAAVDADLASTARPAPRPAPAASAPKPQPKAPEGPAAVRNAFAAKQQPAEAPSRLPLWLALGTLTVAGIAIGGYVWYQLHAMNNGSLVSPGPAAVANVAPPVPAAPAGTSPAAATAQNSNFGPFSRSTVGSPPAETEAPLFPRRAPQNAAPRAESEDVATPPIRLTRTRPEPDANLLRGHASLQRGDTELSRREFEQALQRDPNNTDALLALAAIAQRQGRPGDAEALRQRALVANPGDPAVQAAALGSSAAGIDANTTESRLKSLLSSQPESAPLNFALGNVLARQGRWAEAQQLYFNAVAAEGDNPDYLFNLAVSLDHIRQSRLAAQHYRLALEAAAKRPAGFDRSKVEKRLSELQGESQP